VASSKVLTTDVEVQQRFTTLDWIGATVAGFAALGLLAFPVAGRAFTLMYRDFGSSTVPALTRLATSWWFPVALGLLSVTGLSLGFRATALQRRRMWVVGAFFLAGIGLALCLVGAYLPIFSLSDKIKGE
jgi:hypothetical protein